MDIPLQQLGYSLVKEIKRNILIAKKKGSRERNLVCIKFGSKQEIELLGDVFPKISKTLFHWSELPELKDWGIVDNNYWIAMKYYEGTHYTWTEHDEISGGGKAIPTSAIEDLLHILSDLLQIPLNLVENIVPRFDDNYWLGQFREKSKDLIEKGFINTIEVKKIHNFITNNKQPQQYIFTNGDFYFRNIILQPNNMWVIIDWNKNERFPITPSIEPIENLIAYVWLLMWRNKNWQKHWIQKSLKKFGLNSTAINKAIAIKTFNQAHFYEFICHDTKLAKIQINLLNKFI